MINDKVKLPKIVHSKVPQYRRKFSAIVSAFRNRILAGAETHLGPSVFDPTPENLLHFRTELARTIKAGMLERKDMEAEIAALAVIVWFMRLTAEERTAVTGLW